MSGKHVFISYIREDGEAVDELQSALESAGLEVWRDTKDLWPGDDWALKIRQAIKANSLVFVACFSTALDRRDVSYQHEELTVAAEEYRLRPTGTNWLMTVRFDECAIPAVDLGGGRRLNETIQRTDVFGKGKLANVSRLIASIIRLVEGTSAVQSEAVTRSGSEARRVEGDQTSPNERMRSLLRDPAAEMDFDELLIEIRSSILEQLRDRDRFPINRDDTLKEGNVQTARRWVTRVRDYEAVVAPSIEPLKLAAMYGRQEHVMSVNQTMRALCQEGVQETGLDLFRFVHEYAPLTLTYVAGLGAISRQNFLMFRAMVEDVRLNYKQLAAKLPYVAYSGGRNVTGDWEWLGTVLAYADEEPPRLDDETIEAIRTKRIGNRYTPISDHLFELLEGTFATNFVSSTDYKEAFDEVEILFDAIAADARKQGEFWGPHGGYGRYTWSHRHSGEPPEKKLLEAAVSAGSGWTPLLAGMFGGDPERARVALEEVCAMAARIRDQHW